MSMPNKRQAPAWPSYLMMGLILVFGVGSAAITLLGPESRQAAAPAVAATTLQPPAPVHQPVSPAAASDAEKAAPAAAPVAPAPAPAATPAATPTAAAKANVQPPSAPSKSSPPSSASVAKPAQAPAPVASPAPAVAPAAKAAAPARVVRPSPKKRVEPEDHEEPVSSVRQVAKPVLSGEVREAFSKTDNPRSEAPKAEAAPKHETAVKHEQPAAKAEPAAAKTEPAPSVEAKPVVKAVTAAPLVPRTVSPSVVAVAGERAWVKLDDQKTVIVTKGEAVPGLGTFQGQDTKGAKFDSGVVPVSP